MTCTVVSGWIRNLALYTKDEDFPVGKSVDLNGMTDIKDTSWQTDDTGTSFSSMENFIEVVKLQYPGLAEAEFEVFEVQKYPGRKVPSSYILDVKRKDDWYQLAIFKILKGDSVTKFLTPTHFIAFKGSTGKGVKVCCNI